MGIFNRLPVGYQEVEYIESDGTQYIDTGITSITKEFAIEMNFSITISQAYQTLWCCRTHNVDVTRTCFTTALTGFRNDQGNQTSISASLSLNQKYNLKSTKTQFILDDAVLKDNISTTNNAINDKVWLLSSYAVGTSNPSNQFYGKIYSCKIWDNDELIRYYIPCYRKSDDEIGLYDIVNNVFYENEGTGVFVKGDNVDSVKAISIGLKEVKQIEDTNGNIWWKKESSHENLFDPTTAVIMESYFQTGQSIITASAANRMSYIQCKPNTTYEISKLLGKVFWVGYTTQYPENGIAVSGITQGTQDTFDGTTRTSLDYTTGSNATYLVFRYTQIYLDGSANADTIKNSIEIYEK